MNWDEVVSFLADEIATRVVSKIREDRLLNRTDTHVFTPATEETKRIQEKFGTAVVGVQHPEQPLIDIPPNKEDERLDKKGIPEVTYKDKRVAELMGQNIRTLKNKVSAVEDEPKEKYDSFSKTELVEYIFNLETIMGRTIEAQLSLEDKNDDAEDTDEEDLPDDNESDVLTREQAEKLNLKSLKEYALRQPGVTQADLRGLDIEAVLDLLYNSEGPTEEPEDSDEEVTLELTIDEIKQMNLGQLKKLADELNEMGATINYTRSTISGELLEMILDCLEEE